jgi:hypothetical protein
MIKLTAVGIYAIGLAMLVFSLLGILELVDFKPLAGLVLYLLLREVSEFIIAINFKGDKYEE